MDYIGVQTYPILQDEAPAGVAELAMDHHARAVISSMFLGVSRRDGDGVFGDLGREPVVGPKRFLFESAGYQQARGGRESVTLQFWQWQMDVRASSGEARSR